MLHLKFFSSKALRQQFNIFLNKKKKRFFVDIFKEAPVFAVDFA